MVAGGRRQTLLVPAMCKTRMCVVAMVFIEKWNNEVGRTGTKCNVQAQGYVKTMSETRIRD